jgi:hypothetical protein
MTGERLVSALSRHSRVAARGSQMRREEPCLTELISFRSSRESSHSEFSLARRQKCTIPVIRIRARRRTHRRLHHRLCNGAGRKSRPCRATGRYQFAPQARVIAYGENPGFSRMSHGAVGSGVTCRVEQLDRALDELEHLYYLIVCGDCCGRRLGVAVLRAQKDRRS